MRRHIKGISKPRKREVQPGQERTNLLQAITARWLAPQHVVHEHTFPDGYTITLGVQRTDKHGRNYCPMIVQKPDGDTISALTAYSVATPKEVYAQIMLVVNTHRITSIPL